MKKINKILALALASTLSLCLIGNAESDSTSQQKEEYSVTLADFESYDDILNLRETIQYYSFIGSFGLTNDKEKVITGNGSMEMYIEGTINDDFYFYKMDTGCPAFIHYDLWSNTKNKGNWGFEWKYLSELSIDVYNPNDFPLDVTMFTVSRDYFPQLQGGTVVAPKETKTLKVNVNRYFMQNELTRKISFLSLSVDYDKTILDNGDLYYKPAYVYFDNLQAKVNENVLTDSKGRTQIYKKFANEEEILNFSDPNDIEYVYEVASSYATEKENKWASYGLYTGIGSSVYYNKNPKFVKEGNEGSLEWRLLPTDNAKFFESNYQYVTAYNFTYTAKMTGITVCADFLDYYNFTRLKTGDYKIVVDVYNDFDYAKEVAFGMHDKSGIAKEITTQVYPYSYGTSNMTDVWYKLKPKAWTTLEITDFSKLDFSQGFSRLRLSTTLIDINEQNSFYVNNLRIVKKTGVA